MKMLVLSVLLLGLAVTNEGCCGKRTKFSKWLPKFRHEKCSDITYPTVQTKLCGDGHVWKPIVPRSVCAKTYCVRAECCDGPLHVVVVGDVLLERGYLLLSQLLDAEAAEEQRLVVMMSATLFAAFQQRDKDTAQRLIAKLGANFVRLEDIAVGAADGWAVADDELCTQISTAIEAAKKRIAAHRTVVYLFGHGSPPTEGPRGVRLSLGWHSRRGAADSAATPQRPTTLGWLQIRRLLEASRYGPGAPVFAMLDGCHTGDLVAEAEAEVEGNPMTGPLLLLPACHGDDTAATTVPIVAMGYQSMLMTNSLLRTPLDGGLQAIAYGGPFEEVPVAACGGPVTVKALGGQTAKACPAELRHEVRCLGDAAGAPGTLREWGLAVSRGVSIFGIRGGRPLRVDYLDPGTGRMTALSSPQQEALFGWSPSGSSAEALSGAVGLREQRQRRQYERIEVRVVVHGAKVDVRAVTRTSLLEAPTVAAMAAWPTATADGEVIGNYLVVTS